MTQFCEMSAVDTICVTEPPRWLCEYLTVTDPHRLFCEWSQNGVGKCVIVNFDVCPSTLESI